MNFCAAPAMQTSERTNADPGVKALVQMVQSHLNDQPKARATLHTEGTLPHEGIYDESEEAEKDLGLMRDAALAWRATGNEAYLRLVDRFLFAWITTYQPSFNPIDETNFESLILAYDLTASALPVKTRNAANAFITKMVTGYVADIDKQKRPLTGHVSEQLAEPPDQADCDGRVHHRRPQAYQRGAAAVSWSISATTSRRMDRRSISPNATRCTTSTYDLQPLVTAALAARRHNRNWLTERAQSGATLAAALNWLTPYALGTQHARRIRAFERALRCHPPRGRLARLFGHVGSEKRGRTVSSRGASRRALCADCAASRAHAAGVARGLFAVAGALISLAAPLQEQSWQSAFSTFSKSASVRRVRIRSGRCAPP